MSVQEFIERVYRGEMGVKAEEISKIINGTSYLQGILQCDPFAFDVPPENIQLHFLNLCITENKLLEVHQNCRPVPKHYHWIGKRHTVADHLKELFFLWANKRFGFTSEQRSESMMIFDFRLHLNFNEKYLADAPQKSITTTSMFATIYPFIRDERGHYERNIYEKARGVFEFLHEKSGSRLHPYVRMSGEFEDIFDLDCHQFDMRGTQFKMVRFYSSRCSASSPDFAQSTKEILLKKRLHANFQGADLSHSTINGEILFEEAFTGADLNGVRKQTKFSKLSTVFKQF